ncbi:hypothetical protein RF11_09737 [Thelohanellus kitauei]|uniref:Uncharacterized protein n=1 Tax=Thelohanellus kitauei TaxID=669202 RepID=A0A0C2JCJ1_THEKT|nr:hypothetical protein RF11_09737 [Thelohanellus kitauei]
MGTKNYLMTLIVLHARANLNEENTFIINYKIISVSGYPNFEIFNTNGMSANMLIYLYASGVTIILKLDFFNYLFSIYQITSAVHSEKEAIQFIYHNNIELGGFESTRALPPKRFKEKTSTLCY